MASLLRRFRTLVPFLIGSLMALLLSGTALAAPSMATISGFVKSGLNEPVADALVEAVDPASGIPVADATTNAAGHYLLKVNPGPYDLRVSPPAGSGFGSQILPGIEARDHTNQDFIVAGAEPAGTPLNIMTTTAAVAGAMVTVSGTVKNDGNLPVAGAAIEVVNPSTLDVVTAAATDWAGAYSLTLVTGTYDVRAVPPAGSDYVASVTQGVNIVANTTLDFVLVPKGSLVTYGGHLLNPHGAGLEGQTMRLYGPNADVRTTTGSGGAFSIQVPPGTYTLEIGQWNPDPVGVPQHFYIQASGIALTGSRSLEIELPVRQVQVQVQDTAGNPVSGASVYTGWGYPSLPGALFGAQSTWGYSEISSSYPYKTDDTGVATFWLVDTTYDITAMPPSGVDLGGQGLHTAIAADTKLTVTLPPMVALKGKVTNKAGEPLPEAYINLYGVNGDKTVMTDSSGLYSFQMAPGRYRMYVYGDDRNGQHVADWYWLQAGYLNLSTSQTLDLVLPIRRVDVHVQDNGGNAVAGAKVYTFWWDGAKSAPFPAADFSADNYAYAASDYGRGSLLADANGNATLWLTEGNYTLSAESAPSATLTGSTALSVIGDTALTLTVNPTVTLQGTLRGHDGEGLPGQTLQVRGPNGDVTVTTGAAGAYSMQVGTGEYHYLIWRYPSANPVNPAHAPNYYWVSAHNFTFTGEPVKDFSLPIKQVKVRVQDPAGNPVPGVILATPEWNSETLPLDVMGVNKSASVDGYYYHRTSSLGGQVTDANGEAALWLFANFYSGQSYSIAAIPPANLPFVAFSLPTFQVTADRELVIVLQFSHNPPTTTATVTGAKNEHDRYIDSTTVIMTAEDPDGYELAGTYYRIDGGPVRTYSGPFQVTGGGLHGIKYWSRDTTGVVETPKNLTVEIEDVTPPTVTAALNPAPNAGGWNNANVTVTWEVTDPESGIASTTCAETILTAETAGTTLACEATNKHGLQGTGSVSVKIDLTAPVTEASQANGTVTFTATDSLSGLLATFYQVDSGDVKSGSSVTVSEAGTHTVAYWSADKAGNLEKPLSLEVKAGTGDTAPPVTTADPPAPADWVREWTLHLTAEDDQSGVAATYIKGFGSLVTYVDPGLTLNRTGVWDLAYWSVDNAGNAGTPSEYVVMVDHHGPYVWATGYLAPDGIHIFLGGADNQSGMDYLEWSLDHQNWQRYTGPFLLPETFSGKIYYRGYDRLGNVTDCVVDIDNILSEGANWRVCGNSQPNSTITISVTDLATGQVYAVEVATDENGDWCGELIAVTDCTCTLHIGGSGSGGGGGGWLIDVKSSQGGGGGSFDPEFGWGWYGGGGDITITLNPKGGGGSGVAKVEVDTGGDGGWVEVPLNGGGGGSYTIPGGTLGSGGHNIRIRTTDGHGNTDIEIIHINIDGQGPSLGGPDWGGGWLVDVKPPQCGGAPSVPECGCGWYGGGEAITITLNPNDGGGSGVAKVEVDTGDGSGWVEVPLSGGGGSGSGSGGGSYTIPGGTLGNGGHDIRIRTTDRYGNFGIETIHINIDSEGPSLGEPDWGGGDLPTFNPTDSGSGLDSGWWDEEWDSHCGCRIKIYRAKDKTGNVTDFELYPVEAVEQMSYEGEQKQFSLGDLSVIPGTGPWSARVWWSDDSQPESFSSATNALTRPHTYKDNGQYTAMVLVFNSKLQGALIEAPIKVQNLPPEITSLAGPTMPLLLGTPVTLSADFKDPGILDSHTATIQWGDGSVPENGTVTETLNTNGVGSVGFPAHTYTAPGVYAARITVTDKDGASDEAFYTYVVIYNPNGGFVTGGGWIDSPAGASLADPALSGQANFGINAKYLPGANVPSGETEFQVQNGKFNFHSTSYDWLAVSGARAWYQGSGTINGTGDYGFMVIVVDGPNKSGVDKFRIKVWDKATGSAIYDSQPGASPADEPEAALGSGSIVIHDKE